MLAGTQVAKFFTESLPPRSQQQTNVVEQNIAGFRFPSLLDRVRIHKHTYIHHQRVSRRRALLNKRGGRPPEIVDHPLHKHRRLLLVVLNAPEMSSVRMNQLVAAQFVKHACQLILRFAEPFRAACVSVDSPFRRACVPVGRFVKRTCTHTKYVLISSAQPLSGTVTQNCLTSGLTSSSSRRRHGRITPHPRRSTMYGLRGYRGSTDVRDCPFMLKGAHHNLVSRFEEKRYVLLTHCCSRVVNECTFIRHSLYVICAFNVVFALSPFSYLVQEI